MASTTSIPTKAAKEATREAEPLPGRKGFRKMLRGRSGFRLRLCGALLLAATALLLMTGAVFMATVELYQKSAPLGLNDRDYMTIGAIVLQGLVSLVGLGVSLWVVIKTYARHAAAVEKEASFHRSIIENSADAILTVDTNGTIHSHNPAALTLFEYTSEQLLRLRITQLIPQRHLLHDIVTLGTCSFVAFGQRQNRLTFPVEIAITPVAPAAGTDPRLFVVSIHDTSERGSSHDTLQQLSLSVSSTTGEEFVRTLLQQLSQVFQGDCVFLLETQESTGITFGTLTLAEQGHLRAKTEHLLEGTVFAEALQRGITAYPRGASAHFPHDEILRSLQAESFIATPLIDPQGKTIGLIGFISAAPMENSGVARQTLQIYASRAAAEVARKQETEVLTSERERLHGDYTLMRATAERERRQYEEDIATEQEMLAVTLRSIREGWITIDNSGLVMMLNPTAEELLGWSQAEADDRPLHDILRLSSRRQRRPIDTSLILQAREQLTSQLILTARDGTERLVEASAAPIRNRQDRKLGTVIVLRDVTEKSRVEEERHKAEKLESLGLAAGGIAHDFNNLLTAIIGNLSLALRETSPGSKDRIEASRNASLRAQDLAQQLLTFAKGGAPIKKTASLGHLVRDTVSFSLSGTHVRPSLDIPADLWPVDVDAGQISQVISNLVVNALQAMPEGGTLHVIGENTIDPDDTPLPLAPGRYVRIIVRDEGSGIPEEILKKIFDPYFTTKPKGSGLGLATSYSIVKNHGGLIHVTSSPESGATFTIDLPASDAEEAPEAPAPMAPLSGQRGKVLVLDDEEVICELVACTLTPLGFTVAQSFTAEETLRLYKEALDAGDPFDVVIMDLTIPGGMGGKEAVKKLLELHPTARAIVSSGYAMDPIMSRHKDYGFSGVIAKPYDISELQRVVSATIAE